MMFFSCRTLLRRNLLIWQDVNKGHFREMSFIKASVCPIEGES